MKTPPQQRRMRFSIAWLCWLTLFFAVIFGIGNLCGWRSTLTIGIPLAIVVLLLVVTRCEVIHGVYWGAGLGFFTAICAVAPPMGPGVADPLPLPLVAAITCVGGATGGCVDAIRKGKWKAIGFAVVLGPLYGELIFQLLTLSAHAPTF